MLVLVVGLAGLADARATLPAGVAESVALRAEQHRSGRPHPFDDCLLPCATLGTALAESGTDRDDRACPDREGGVVRFLERSCRNGEDDELGASGSSANEVKASLPSTSPPRLFTRNTVRRCSPRSAPRASHWPTSPDH